MGVRCGAARTISAASQPATSHASLATPPDPCSRFAANSRRRGDMSRHGFQAWAGAAIAARPRMTGVVAWIAGAMLLMASIGPALAQTTTTSPDEAGAADQSAPPQPRSDFPY